LMLVWSIVRDEDIEGALGVGLGWRTTTRQKTRMNLGQQYTPLNHGVDLLHVDIPILIPTVRWWDDLWTRTWMDIMDGKRKRKKEYILDILIIMT
jgi:hypothetical protein